ESSGTLAAPSAPVQPESRVKRAVKSGRGFALPTSSGDAGGWAIKSGAKISNMMKYLIPSRASRAASASLRPSREHHRRSERLKSGGPIQNFNRFVLPPVAQTRPGGI